jgi:hypothetical protein
MTSLEANQPSIVDRLFGYELIGWQDRVFALHIPTKVPLIAAPTDSPSHPFHITYVIAYLHMCDLVIDIGIFQDTIQLCSIFKASCTRSMAPTK